MPALSKLYRPLLIALPALIALVLVGFLAWGVQTELQQQRAAEARSAKHQAQVLATVLTEHVQRSFEQADVVAKMISERVIAQGYGVDLAALARQGTIPLDVFVQVGVTDAKGMLRASTVDNFKPIDLSDRAHIRVHLADPAHGPYISKPLLGRASGRWSIQYSRAILGADGSMHGVIVISLDPTYFSTFHQQVDIGEHGTISVIGTEDRTVRTQRAGNTFSAGQELPSDDTLFRALRGARHGTYDQTDADGSAHFVGYDSLGKYPLALVVAYDRNEYLAQTEPRRHRLTIAAGVLALLLALAGLGGSFAVLRDLRTARKTTRLQLRATQSAEQFDATVEVIPVGLLFVDAQMHVTRANAAFRALSGLEDGSIRQAHLQSLLDRWCDAQQLDPHVRADALCARDPHHAERRVMLTRTAPPEQRIEIRTHAFASNIGGFVLLVRDITHAQAFDRAQSELVGAAAHELRGPIARIEGFGDLLALGNTPPEKHLEVVELLRRQAHQLRRTFDDLIDLAEIDLNGDRKFRYERIDLREIAAEIVDEHARHGDKRLASDLGAEPAFARCDRIRITKAIAHLVDNALKFSSAATAVQFRIAVDRDRNLVRVIVQDQGPGMSAEQQHRLLQRRRNAERRMLNVSGGLGLSLVVAIVELHDGHVAVQSSTAGTLAHIELPIAADAQSDDDDAPRQNDA